MSPEKFQLKNKIMKDIAEKFLFPYIDYDFFEVTAKESPDRLTFESVNSYRSWRQNISSIPILESGWMERATATVTISFEVSNHDALTEYYILSNFVNSLMDISSFNERFQEMAENHIALYYRKYGDENERTSKVTTFMLKLAASGIYPIHKFIDLLASMGDSMPKKTMARVQNERQRFIQQFDVAEQFSL